MGSLVAFLTYASQILMSFMQLSAVAVMVPRAQVSAVRVREILERQDKITDEQVNNELNESVSNSLALHQVSFKFDEAKR